MNQRAQWVSCLATGISTTTNKMKFTDIPLIMEDVAKDSHLTGPQRKELVMQVLRAEFEGEQLEQAEALIEIFVAIRKGYYVFAKSARCGMLRIC